MVDNLVVDKSIAEREFQNETVKNLTGHYDNVKSWASPDELDGTKHKVTYKDLINNWRKILDQQNTKVLENIELTDEEFSQVMTRVNALSNSYEAAKLLASENATGKIDNIIRNAPGATSRRVTLRIFEKAQVNGGDTVYQIAREVWTENDKNRFDIVLLINGLPVINIEQKRTDKTVDEAYGQFKRYYKDGEYIHNFFAFSQMMVVMTEIDTRYFATPKNASSFNKAFLFRWADKDNRPITKMAEVAKTLLRIPMAHQMVGDYLIINEDTTHPERAMHMLMRPYQVEALRAIEWAANGWDVESHIPHGGYIWHTTGSGKTITSFKAATSLSKKFEKVIFLLDRKDLDKQTSDNFKAYSQYDSIDVDDSPYTDSLRRKLQSSMKGVVIATTYKLSNVVKDLLENGDSYNILDKTMAIIVDEAHRTTMGEMMMTIMESFKKSLFFGFTGTPLFDENHVNGIIDENYERYRTTSQMFGPELHRYTIDQAIKDRNVLGFHVNYMNTGEFNSYSDLVPRWIKIRKSIPGNKLTDEQLQQKALELEGNHNKDQDGITNGRAILENDVIFGQDVKEVPEGGIKYQDEKHIPQVVTLIIDDWEKQSKGIINNESKPYKFNAILTVALKSRVMQYYQEFKKQLAERKVKLNFTATFSAGNGNSEEGSKDQANLRMIFDDWHVLGHPHYNVDSKKAEQGEPGFFADITSVFKNGGHGLKDNNLDLIIVAERLLTGFDSKLTNTLYIDRQLKLQGLIQAYSRTNRVYGPDKEFGSIVNFMYPAKTRYSLEQALWLYGSGGSNSRVIMAEYPLVVQEFRPIYEEMHQILLDPENWIDLKDDEENKMSFLTAFKNSSKQLNFLAQYYEFDWNGFGEKELPLTEELWLKYQGAYNNLKPSGPGVVDEDLIDLGSAKLADTQTVTFDEIIHLIGKAVGEQPGFDDTNEENLRLINENIMKLRSFGDNDNAELLQKFMVEVVDNRELNPDKTVAENFHEFVVRKGKEQIVIYARKQAVDPIILRRVYDSFNEESESIDYMDDLRKSSNYKESEWYKDKSINHGLAPVSYKNMLNETTESWLRETKAIYKNLDD